jgi:hypothetical protein
MKELVEYLAGSLWEWSALRHGMFTPPEFRELCERNLKEALNTAEGRALLAAAQSPGERARAALREIGSAAGLAPGELEEKLGIKPE